MDYNSISVCDELHSGIYILQRNDHIGTNIFKIGRTDVGIFNRYTSGYDTDSKLYYYCPVKNTKSTESFILDNLRNNNLIKYRRDLGLEYFESEYISIFETVNNLCNYLKIEHNYNMDELINYCNDNHNKITPIKYEHNKNIIYFDNDAYNIETNTIYTEPKINKCNRCGYETNKNANLIRHLKNLNKCKPILSNIEPSELLKIIPQNSKAILNDNGITVYNCKYCKREFNLNSTKSRHEKICNLKDKIDLLSKLDIEIINKKIINNDTNFNINSELEKLKLSFEQLKTEYDNSKIDNQILQNENKYLLSVIELLKSKK